MNPGQVAAIRSHDEIADAIRRFTPADWARLKKIAGYYSRRQIEAPDLLQEALARSLDGRICPSGIDVITFLAGAMRSIADGEGEKIEHRLVLVSVAKTGDHQVEAFNYPDPSQGLEAQIIGEEDATRIRCDILALFDDDQLAHDIVEGTMEYLTAEELRELTGIDKTTYDSKRKLIRRRINKKYPGGWKP